MVLAGKCGFVCRRLHNTVSFAQTHLSLCEYTCIKPFVRNAIGLQWCGPAVFCVRTHLFKSVGLRLNYLLFSVAVLHGAPGRYVGVPHRCMHIQIQGRTPCVCAVCTV